MSAAKKMVTEREAVLREHAAYLKGAASEAVCFHKGPGCDMCRHTAALEYPLPKVTRARVVVDPIHCDYEWQVGDGLLWFRWKVSGAWKRAGSNTENLLLVPTVERVTLWADLLANPTEEVEADA